MEDYEPPRRQLHPIVITTLVLFALAAVVVPAALGNADPGDVFGSKVIDTGGNDTTTRKPTSTGTGNSPTCWGNGGSDMTCMATRDQDLIDEVVRSAYAQIVLPDNNPSFGPPPDQNQWGMIPVGYPIWLWAASDTTSVTHSVTDRGFTVSLTGRRLSVAFDMGDGKTIRCTAFTKRPAKLTGDPMKKSPNCGYVYTKPGTYTLRTTTTWLILWQVGDYSGSFVVTLDAVADEPLVIGELLTVITPG